uniref:Uncharacterized protein n=1 Tax=Caenorhabditis japonica TaxID=281687 RepID=A0A8R1IV70_CAEJA
MKLKCVGLGRSVRFRHHRQPKIAGELCGTVPRSLPPELPTHRSEFFNPILCNTSVDGGYTFSCGPTTHGSSYACRGI